MTAIVQPRTPARPAPAPAPTPAAAERRPPPAAATRPVAGMAQEAAPRVALSAPVELAGNATFTPPAEVAAVLAATRGRPAAVPVRFGELAAGTVQIHARDGRYDTPAGPPQAIPLILPVLDAIAVGVAPVLAIEVRNSTVAGYVTFAGARSPAGKGAVFDAIRGNATALGWTGFAGLTLSRPVNALTAGAFKLSTDLAFTLGGFLRGQGTFGLDNTRVVFNAEATASVPGLAAVKLGLVRNPDGTITGGIDVPLAFGKSISGHVKVTFVGGVVDVLGTGTLSTEKLQGDFTVQVTDAATAREVGRRLLPPSAIRAEAAQATGDGAAPTPRPGPRAVVGWGTLHAQFNRWLGGTATVIMDSAGNVTVVGRIAPPPFIPLFKTGGRIRFLDIHPSFGFGVPYLARGYIGANIWVEAFASVESHLEQVEINGIYSTDPAVFNEFSIAGTLIIAAVAGLEGYLGVEGGIELLGHDVKVGAGVKGTAAILGKAEARPTLAYRELADPKEGRRGEFTLSGYAEVAAQPFLGLAGEAHIQLITPWWSPLHDHTWPKDLGSKEWPLGGPFGYGFDFNYVLGSGTAPEITPRKPTMDGEALMSNLMDDKLESGTHSRGQVPATFKDHTPPPPPPAAPPPKRSGRPGAKPPGPRPEHRQRWEGALKAIGDLARQSRTQPYSEPELQRVLGGIRARFGLERLDAPSVGNDFEVHAKLGDATNDQRPARVRRKPPAPGEAPAGVGPHPAVPVQKPRDLRQQIHNALVTQLTAPHDRDQVRKIVASVANEFKNRGLVRLELGPETRDGHYPILAETTPLTAVAVMETGRPTASVNLGAVVRFRKPVDLPPQQFAQRPYSQGIPTSREAVGKTGQLLYPGVPPTPGPFTAPVHADVLQVATWNVGWRQDRNTSNKTHAEAQFLSWLERVVQHRWMNLESVHLHITHSPCMLCSADFHSWLRVVLESNPGFRLRIDYAEPFYDNDHPLSTTVGDINRLTALGDNVVVTPIGQAVWLTNAQRDQIQAREWGRGEHISGRVR